MSRITNAQMAQMMEQMMAQMAQMQARMEQMEASQAGASTSQAQPKAQKERTYEYVKADGTVKMCTEGEYRNYMRIKERAEKRTPEQKELAEKIKANKAAEPERTRKLEKLLGIKAGSLKNTACTADECRALGWKGTRKELKALKAKVRGTK